MRANFSAILPLRYDPPPRLVGGDVVLLIAVPGSLVECPPPQVGIWLSVVCVVAHPLDLRWPAVWLALISASCSLLLGISYGTSPPLVLFWLGVVKVNAA